MSLIVSSVDSGNRFLIDEGSHLARCCWVIDIGTQDTDFGPKRKLVIGWELPEIQRTFDDNVGPEPAAVTKFYSSSLSEKSNLRKDLELWRGRAFTADELAGGFDLRKLLNAACLLTITHKANSSGERRAVVAGIGKLPAAVSVPDLTCRALIYDLDEPDYSVFSVLPKWIQHCIAESDEYRALAGPGQVESATETHSDNPF